ncbi:PH domain-containing protein [Halobacillus sp. BBL2006]|uniref:PH domain-containing protein n=1 Tax=Halobacillus sp. BBL2006 TaxID=1543706 RepID=UPI0005442A48|nr:PH domain-containing protein [Halobacillus sp. BBL2006]KHE72462.1 hypothetical protein LD39_04440 [Halobacillus sp. BBL2006]
MVFKAERDRFFTAFIIKVSVNMTLMLIFPFIFAPEFTHNIPFTLVWSTIYIYLLSTIIFTTINIKYVFRHEYLHVKGGPFSKKVPYAAIFKVTSTPDIYEGRRVVTAGDALEIFYEEKKAKSIKITPKDESRFLDLLKYHSPQAKLIV